MTTTSRFSIASLILLLVLFCAGSALAVQPPIPENPLLTKNYQIYGETSEALLQEALTSAVASGAGQLYFSPYMFRARNLLEAYLERNARDFVTRYDIQANEVRGGQRFLDVNVIVDLRKLYADLNQKQFLYEPAFRPVFYLFFSEQFNGQPVAQPLARKYILEEIAAREYRYLWSTRFRPNLLNFLVAAAWADGQLLQSEMLRMEDLVFGVLPELYRSEWNNILSFLDPTLVDREKELLRNKMWDYSHDASTMRRIQSYLRVEEAVGASEATEALQALLNSTRTADEQRFIESILRSLLAADGEVSSQEQSLLDATLNALSNFQPNYLALEARLSNPNPEEDQSDDLRVACREAQRYGIEVFLTGSVNTTAESAEKYYFDNVHFVTSEATLHLVRTDTCEILATASATVSASDRQVNAARDAASLAAIRKVLPEVLAAYEQQWGKMVLAEKNWGPIPYRKNTLLKVMAVGMTPDKVSALVEKFKTLAPPKAEVYTRATFEDIAVLSVSWDGTSEDILNLMRETSFPGFSIKRIAPDAFILESVE